MAFKTFTAGEQFTAADVNTYLAKQAVIVCSSSATYPTSPVDGMTVFDEALDSLVIYNGGWVQALSVGAAGDSSWSPVISQGSTVTATTNQASYVRMGQVVTCWCTLTVTGSGTTSTIVTVTLPVNQATHVTNGIIGSGFIFDASTSKRYAVNVASASAATVNFPAVADDATVGGGAWGNGGTITQALASGDVIAFTATYMVA